MQTISPEYVELNKQLHIDRPDYGAFGGRNAPEVMKVARMLGAKSILDYGCGKGQLGEVLRVNGWDVREYDPAVEGKDTPPAPADLVYCGDVAEHVEEQFIDAFLDDLRRLSNRAMMIIVATYPAKKTLADGRNAHITIRPMHWWVERLEARFKCVRIDAAYQVDKESMAFTYIGVPR